MVPSDIYKQTRRNTARRRWKCTSMRLGVQPLCHQCLLAAANPRDTAPWTLRSSMITWSTVSARADVCIWRHFGDQANKVWTSTQTQLVHGRQLLSRPYMSLYAGAETLAIFGNYLRLHRLDNTPRKQHNLWRKRRDATLCILHTSVCRLVNKMYAMQTSLQHWLQFSWTWFVVILRKMLMILVTLSN